MIFTPESSVRAGVLTQQLLLVTNVSPEVHSAVWKTNVWPGESKLTSVSLGNAGAFGGRQPPTVKSACLKCLIYLLAYPSFFFFYTFGQMGALQLVQDSRTTASPSSHPTSYHAVDIIFQMNDWHWTKLGIAMATTCCLCWRRQRQKVAHPSVTRLILSYPRCHIQLYEQVKRAYLSHWVQQW